MSTTIWRRTAVTVATATLVAVAMAAPREDARKDDGVVTPEEWELALAAQSTIPKDELERTPQLGSSSVGPDVTIINLFGVNNYTSGGGTSCPPGYTGSCRGYAVGTDSCNIGSVPVDWCDEESGCRTTTDAYHLTAPATVSDHSVIAQNLYRLRDGRFEQIGLSFLKHGFLSTNSNDSDCVWNDNGTPNTSCVSPPAGSDQLGVGCTDFYDAGLNGARPLGRRSQVNVADGDHPENPAGGQLDDAYDQRIVVAEPDLDPAQNAGALYWLEGQYIVRDDSRSGPIAAPDGGIHPWLGENGLNNASYRAVTVGSAPALNLSLTGPTVRETAAIFAWQAADPEVEIVDVDRLTLFPGDPIDPPVPPGSFHLDHWVRERFHAARRVTHTGVGSTPYHHEYAIHNMNSDTSADGFSVQFPSGGTFANVGFRDIDHHSGESYDTSDWTIDVDGPNGTITWSAVNAGANTNALRWSTTFSFWFDSSLPAVDIAHTLELFKISQSIPVPFAAQAGVLFADGFESGGTKAWSQTAN